jgi:import receptor subunit TOM70
MFPPSFRFFPCLSNHTTGALPTLPENPSTGDNTLILALEALEASDYAHSLSFINEAIEQGISWELGRAEALNLRGTFKLVLPLISCIVPNQNSSRFLMGDTDGAKADLQESLKLVPSFTQSWVKIASVHMEQSDVAKTFEAFEEAIKHNASDPDIYYHRGQGMWVRYLRDSLC